MTANARTLRVAYESAEVFRQEYQTNLANGGVFVASEESFELREAVDVEIDLVFADKTVCLPGEVVHLVPREIADAGGVPGVAVQFTESAVSVRDRLGAVVAAIGVPEPTQADPEDGRRGSRRTHARVPARIDGGEEVVDGLTRNLSKTGVLVSVQGEGDAMAVGERVELTLRHPTTGEERGIEGEVVRQIEKAGRVSAVAIQFAPGVDEQDEVERFVSDVQSADHARRLGGISGPIEELGPESLVQMFAQSSPAGTLFLRQGDDEGMVGFEGGLMRFAHIGNAWGMKALIRLLALRKGTFEFHARLEEVETTDPPLPLEAALLDAVRQMDEAGRTDGSRFTPETCFAVQADADGAGAMSKIEEAVRDLARAGFTLERIMDVIPEPDPEILRAVESLVDQEIIATA